MLAASLGVIVGLVLGLTGAGGSVLAVPLLIWGMGWTLPQAAPTALLAVSAAAILGTISAWPQGTVRYRAAMVMSATGLLIAPLGLKAAQILPVAVLSGLFAAVLALISIRMLRQAQSRPEESKVVRAGLSTATEPSTAPLCTRNPDTGRFTWTRPCALAVAGSGVMTGFLSGLLGVGGGFVIVPALRSFTDLSFHSAVATSLMAIAVTSAGTVAISIAQGQPLPVQVAMPFVTGALVGMLMGRMSASKIAGPTLQKMFASGMLLVSLGMVATALR